MTPRAPVGDSSNSSRENPDEYGIICLSRKEQIAFVTVLLERRVPNVRLRKAAEKYRRQMRQ